MFYRHKMMADGFLGKCKDCAKTDVSENRRRKADYYKEYEKSRASLPHRVEARRQYALTDRGKERIQAAHAKYRENYPEKYAAKNAVNNAIRDGRLIRQPCEICGAKAEGHHDDYSKPLDVRWLCHAHHVEEHKRLAANAA